MAQIIRLKSLRSLSWAGTRDRAKKKRYLPRDLRAWEQLDVPKYGTTWTGRSLSTYDAQHRHVPDSTSTASHALAHGPSVKASRSIMASQNGRDSLHCHLALL